MLPFGGGILLYAKAAFTTNITKFSTTKKKIYAVNCLLMIIILIN